MLTVQRALVGGVDVASGSREEDMKTMVAGDPRAKGAVARVEVDAEALPSLGEDDEPTTRGIGDGDRTVAVCGGWRLRRRAARSGPPRRRPPRQRPRGGGAHRAFGDPRRPRDGDVGGPASAGRRVQADPGAPAATRGRVRPPLRPCRRRTASGRGSPWDSLIGIVVIVATAKFAPALGRCEGTAPSDGHEVSDETVISLRVHGDVVDIESTSAVLGRSKNTDVQLDEQGISRRHCELLLRPGSLTVRDLGSTHGTFIDGPWRPRRGASADRLEDHDGAARAGRRGRQCPAERQGRVRQRAAAASADRRAVHRDPEPPTAAVAAREALTDETPPRRRQAAPAGRNRFRRGGSCGAWSRDSPRGRPRGRVRTSSRDLTGLEPLFRADDRRLEPLPCHLPRARRGSPSGTASSPRRDDGGP